LGAFPAFRAGDQRTLPIDVGSSNIVRTPGTRPSEVQRKHAAIIGCLAGSGTNRDNQPAAIDVRLNIVTATGNEAGDEVALHCGRNDVGQFAHVFAGIDREQYRRLADDRASVGRAGAADRNAAG
jgi:predicted nucleotidyltransferase